MTCTPPNAFDMVKIEDSTSPEASVPFLEPAPARMDAPAPNDPEAFLKRCSGNNKKTKQRCSSVIGRKAQLNARPTYLPTCSTHRDQKSFAGRCQFQHADGKHCGRLFRWVPPYLELCGDHRGQPDTPCYLLNLPLELRHEIFRYLLPTKPISSSTAALHDRTVDPWDGESPFSSASSRARLRFTRAVPLPPHSSSTLASVFPMPLLDLLLVNRQMYLEAKDLLYSIAAFTIDVRKDGTFMCGRRLLEPRRPDGSSHFMPDETDAAKNRFLRAFDWAAVKNYSVDILLENWSGPQAAMEPTTWDEEVEIYDIRDYVSVVVSGILAKSQNLCKLQVRLCLADFKWQEEQIIANTKLIVSPFERLRNVRQPCLAGVYVGRPYHNSTLCVHRPKHHVRRGLLRPPQLFSVPPLPSHHRELKPGVGVFDDYTAGWARCMSSSSPAPVTKKPPIRDMFTQFKDFYSELSKVVPNITYKNGRHAFLHRARVAREQEDVESFRHLRNELINYWYTYLELQELKKKEMERMLSKMLDADIYPSHKWEKPASTTRHHPSPSPSPVLLNADTMAKEGIPMTGNPRHLQMTPTAYMLHQQRYMQMVSRHQQQANLQVQAQAQAQSQAMFAGQIEPVLAQQQRQQQPQQQQRIQAPAHSRQPAQTQQQQQQQVTQAAQGVAPFSSSPQFATPTRYTQVIGSTANPTPNPTPNLDAYPNPLPSTSTCTSLSLPTTLPSLLSPPADPGPSRKKPPRTRVDSGCEEAHRPPNRQNRHHGCEVYAAPQKGGSGDENSDGVGDGVGDGDGDGDSSFLYTGKGKGKGKGKAKGKMDAGGGGRAGEAVWVGFCGGD